MQYMAAASMGMGALRQGYDKGTSILNQFNKDYPIMSQRAKEELSLSPPPVGGSKKRRKTTKRKSNKRTKRKRTKRKSNKRNKKKIQKIKYII